MERLTKRMPRISHSLSGNVIYAKCENCTDRKPECYGEDCPVTIEALLKLADYEETGLTPEEATAMRCREIMRVVNMTPELEGVLFDRLREIAKADKEGRCVVLPCKVGDTVFRIGKEGSVCDVGDPKCKIFDYWEVEHIEIYADEILFVDDSDNTFTEKDIGKTVFLTREEAEAALKRGRTMADLIDREAFMKEYGRRNPEAFEFFGYAAGWNALYTVITDFPAVDAEQVRHGRWVKMGGFTACSECGCSPADWEPKPDNPRGLPPYCHSCGAKMDKEAEQ